ncbi:MAG TPA: hypothetical protein VJH71_00015 [Candidatus Paceibacterota bacterium]
MNYNKITKIIGAIVVVVVVVLVLFFSNLLPGFKPKGFDLIQTKITQKDVLPFLPVALPVGLSGNASKYVDPYDNILRVSYLYNSSQTAQAVESAYKQYFGEEKWVVLEAGDNSTQVILNASNHLSGEKITITIDPDSSNGLTGVAIEFLKQPFREAYSISKYPDDFPRERGVSFMDSREDSDSKISFIRSYKSRLNLAENREAFNDFFDQNGWRRGPDIPPGTSTVFATASRGSVGVMIKWELVGSGDNPAVTITFYQPK